MNPSKEETLIGINVNENYLNEKPEDSSNNYLKNNKVDVSQVSNLSGHLTSVEQEQLSTSSILVEKEHETDVHNDAIYLNQLSNSSLSSDMNVQEVKCDMYRDSIEFNEDIKASTHSPLTASRIPTATSTTNSNAIYSTTNAATSVNASGVTTVENRKPGNQEQVLSSDKGNDAFQKKRSITRKCHDWCTKLIPDHPNFNIYANTAVIATISILFMTLRSAYGALAEI
jgi:hypothetical protein